MRRQVAVFACVAVMTACGSEAADSESPNSMSACADRADEFSLGTARDTKHGLYTVQLLVTDPTPPDVGENTWVLKVTDSDGALVTGAQITVEPTMVHHGHGSFPPAFFSRAGTDEGSYTINVGLHMSGYWKMTLTVTDSGDNADTVVFSYCLEG